VASYSDASLDNVNNMFVENRVPIVHHDNGLGGVRTRVALLLRPTIEPAYGTVRRWLADQPGISSITILDEGATDALHQVVAPRTVRVAPSIKRILVPIRPDQLLKGWRIFFTLFNHFGTIVVLCATDDDVVGGYTPYRLLAELLFGRRVVLIGPSVSKEWPGGRGLATLVRARELVALVSAALVGMGTTLVAFAAVGAQEAVVWLIGRERAGR